MKLSRRGKSARRGRHTKRAGKHLRYRGKKVRASKRYHRAHKRTYKRGRRVHRGGVLPQGDDDDESVTEPGAFVLPEVGAQELITFVPGQFQKTLHLYYTKTSDVGSRFSVSKFSVDDKNFKIVGEYLNPDFIRSTTNHPKFLWTMTRLDDAAGKTVSFTIELTVEYTVVDEELKLTSITYIDSKGAERKFYVQPGGCKGLLNVMSSEGSIYDFRTGTEGGEAYIKNGPEFMRIVDSIENQIKTRLDEAASQTMPKGAVVTSSTPSKPGDGDTFMPRRM